MSPLSMDEFLCRLGESVTNVRVRGVQRLLVWFTRTLTVKTASRNAHGYVYRFVSIELQVEIAIVNTRPLPKLERD